MSKVNPDITVNDLKTQVFEDFRDSISGIKNLGQGTYLVFMESREDALELTKVFNEATVDGSKIYCIPVMKIAGGRERKIEVRLRE